MTGSINRAFGKRLKNREPLVGTMLTLPSPEVVEVCVGAGFDWLFIDMEHGLIGFTDVQRMIQAAGPCPCIVRVPMNEAISIAKALDTGAAGVIVPHVSTAAEVRRVVRAGKYPPEGDRSIGVARAQGFGARVQDSVDHDNDAVVLVPQAEHIEAAHNIGEIVATPGVDAVFVGPFDLSASMGKPGRIGDAEVQAAIAVIRDGCAAAGVACGLFAVDAESARRAISESYSLVCVGTEALLLDRAAADLIRASKQGARAGGSSRTRRGRA